MFNNLKSRSFSFLLKSFLNSLFFTCSLKLLDEKILFNAAKNKHSLLVCCWHNRGLLLARYFKLNRFDVWGISSTHADSEILARVLTSWNINLIRGSSTRGWFNVIKKMASLFKTSNSIVVVTPDGPRGPIKRAKSGAFKVANKYNAKIIICSASVSQCWRLSSWDKTILPKPFSTIYIRFSPVVFNKNQINGKRISSLINQNQQKLDKYVSKNY